MADVKLCRICLGTGVKLYRYNQHYLKQYYEDIADVEMNIHDGLPNYFCFECAYILHKFHKFKEKCHTGLKILKELLQNGPITLKSVSNIDRKSNKLKSTLDLVVMNKKIKTYLIKSKTIGILEDSIDKKTEDLQVKEEVEIPEINLIETDYDSEDSVNLAQYKNVIIRKENQINKDTNDDGLAIIENEKQCTDANDFNVEDRSMSDGEKSNMEIKNTEPEEKAIDIKNKEHDDKTKKTVNKENNKLKKFERKTMIHLDPEHWLKINLTEEEAVKEFRAREQDPKYVGANYKCTNCYKGFSKEDMLDRHIKLRHNESLGSIVCRFCNMRFKRAFSLTKHIMQYYTKYKCLRCEIVCPLRSTAIFHNDYHNGVIRKCRYCDQEFRHMSTYYTHLRTHRSEHVCTLCGASFVSKTGVAKHKMTMHINTVVNPEEEVDTYCERCGIRFETLKAYEEHVLHSAKHAEGVEKSVEPTAIIAEPKMNPQGKRRDIRRRPRQFTACNVCNKNFSTYVAYQRHHLAEHSGAPMPRAKVNREKMVGEKDVCEKIVTCEKVICEICGAALASASMRSHMNTHTRDRLYTCQLCGMQFNAKCSLNRHNLTHTGEKPFECSLCGKRYTQKCSLKLHIRTFHLKEPYPKRFRKSTNRFLRIQMAEDSSSDESEST